MITIDIHCILRCINKICNLYILVKKGIFDSHFYYKYNKIITTINKLIIILDYQYMGHTIVVCYYFH